MANTTAREAVEMVLAGGNNLDAELSNVGASYIDICEEIEAGDDTADFSEAEYRAALIEAVAG